MAETQPPTFSILVPTYNQAQYLPASLDSLLAQTRGDWEAVVVNDGSPDDTPAVLAAYAARDSRIRPFHQANGGVGSALNHALREARGTWICWLSSDDLLEPDALATFAAAIKASPKVQYFHSDFRELVHETGELRLGPPDRAASLPPKAEQTLSFLHIGNTIHGISVCIRKSLFDAVGPFNPDLPFVQDVDMWLRMSARTELRFLDKRTCITRIHADQGTTRFPEAGFMESARACLEFLNAHPFEDLFPHLDLARGDDILYAVRSALAAALNVRSCMYAGVGPEPALLDRLRDWLWTRCPKAHREALLPGLRTVATQIVTLPASLHDAVNRLATPPDRPYQPRHALELMKAQWQACLAAGDTRSASVLRRYLVSIAKVDLPPEAGAPPVLREAFLLEPDFATEGWAHLTMAYLKGFRPADPVGLLLLLDPGAEAAPGPKEVEAAVLALAQSLGLDAFPEIHLVEQPAEMMAALRPYACIHRLPFPPGPPPLDTPACRRLLRALQTQEAE